MSFRDYPLPQHLIQALDSMGIVTPTDTQVACMQQIFAGQDVALQAKTGSGKTLAFSLPMLAKLKLDNGPPKGLVLCPTRELAEQVAEQIRQAGKGLANLKVVTLVGGLPIGPQIKSLGYGADVLVGTPGRILDLREKRSLDLSAIEVLILDEADRMLDMGFEQQMRTLLQQLKRSANAHQRQTLLFSATFPDAIQAMSEGYQRDPVFIKVDTQDQQSTIKQLAYRVLDDKRSMAVAALLTHYQSPSVMVFCRTRKDVNDLSGELRDMGFNAKGLHGELEQNERSELMARFANKTLDILVATDVAARGLDIEKVDLVINHRVSEDVDTHVHRIGRTGRAQETGTAITLISEQEEDKLDEIAARTDANIEKHHIQSIRFHANRILAPSFYCIQVNGGKRDKLRPGDILGALTKEAGIPVEDIGKITIQAKQAFIAVKLRSVKRCLQQFREGKIKGKRFKARKLS